MGNNQPNINVRLHNAIVDGTVPPPPDPEKSPGPILTGLLMYMAKHREMQAENPSPDAAPINPVELVQVMAQLIDHMAWEEMARMCLAVEAQSSLVVPGRS